MSVLILILMEHSLTLSCSITIKEVKCLNPYSNGTLSDKNYNYGKRKKFCLNPYSNGTLSDDKTAFVLSLDLVLILILMEHSLTPYY